ncbi:hypothetical protein BIY37_10815 [Candidatus Brocadia sapporoensis]|uniref:Uncharacterized protein n=1 Tax=Candidatus Brocadia sapporoensis TaxID=392547 RepID=A0A1V6LXX9_9BACT|nr:hypothetical protein [Candidatus Brocadia sp.]OQD44988.1 hypothetical protein BIY37_10815 [Candidatus Brocadia sapporoensis]GJQ23490.1 MAG: hypothetical protein HBSAPP01_12800 [Candidatus Brocadia sapporoensis]
MIESEFCNRTQTNPARALLNFHSGVVESVQYIAGDFPFNKYLDRNYQKYHFGPGGKSFKF